MKEQWKQLKETITEIRDNNKFDNEDVSSICKFLVNYMNILEKQMSNSEKWIPVSERLPEEGITVIGTNLFGDIYKSECYNDCGEIKWYADGDYDVPIVAWLPLPKPYKAERRE